MASENVKKERFDQLGLPPMELAESTGNSRNSNGVYRCLLPILQILVMLLLTISAAATYVFISKQFETYQNLKSTQIILLKESNEVPNTYHRIRFLNTTTDIELTRKKRETGSPSNNEFDWNEFRQLNLSDSQIQKARELIMKHDIVCNEENKQGICKNFVKELKSITESNELMEADTKNDHRVSDIDDNNKTKQHTKPTPTELAKRETHSATHSTYDPQYPNKAQSSHSHHATNENCILNMMRKHPRETPHDEYLPHHGAAYGHDLAPQARFYMPSAYSSYPQAREISTPRRRHPQDVDILMSFLTLKPERTAAEQSTNSTREVTCPSGTISCLNREACIDSKKWCDGNVDCSDVSDEATCNCKSRVDKSRLCDGYFDCPFGEDEMGCYGCSENLFSCEDLDMNSESTCFSKEQRCNNVYDCPNHKDEVECNMLAPSLLKKPIFAISNTEGFLHRNYKGEWYAVCKYPYKWASDSCHRETGLIIRPPFIEILPIDPMLKINYINTDAGGLLSTSDSCYNSSAIYVVCPDLLCGTRVQSTSQLIRENSAIESHLFGRNKRSKWTNHLYPPIFYRNRWKRNVDKSSIKTRRDEMKTEDSFDNIRNKRTESRVVGGKPSQPAAWPWMVAVYRDGTFHCGGVVITHSWVLSAAHCVHKFWDHYFEVQVGMLRRFSFSPQEQSHRVTHVIVNQHYSESDMKNDLSLMKVEPAIQFSRWVRPICLPSPDTAGTDWLWGPSPGTVCTAVGWGATTEHGPDPDHMREVEMPVWENCKHREDRAGMEICAGFAEGGKDTCQGDSGGPLLCKNPLNSQQWYMAGIVSHGDGCGRKGEPGVYTRVSLFIKWIRYHTTSESLPLIQPIQKCPGFKCESGIPKCLPNKRKCDKIIDCLNGEDEVNCVFPKTVSTFDELVENFASDSKEPSISSEFEDFTHKENFFNNLETQISKNNDNTNTRRSNHLNEANDDDEEDKPEVRSTTSKTVIPTTDFYFEDQMTTTDAISKEYISTSRGDVETIMIDIDRQPPESRSALGKLREENNEDSIIEKSTELLEDNNGRRFETSTSTLTQQDFTESSESMSLSHETNFISSTTTTQPEHKNEPESESEIISLLPNSDDMDQISEPTNHIDTKNITTINDHEENATVKKVSELENNNDLFKKTEDLVDYQPATLRRTPRRPNEFECRRINQIIPYHHRCDRKADCEDGTDELDCTCSDYLVTFDEKLICDGVFDCADGHDETNCFACDADQFLCKRSQKCIPLKNACDGTLHCSSGEDEMDCFALSDGKKIELEQDGRPTVNLEGFLTERYNDKWNVVCDDKLPFEQQEEAATKICRYLGFSSANKFNIKYINVKEHEIEERSFHKREKRDIKDHSPVHFAYRQHVEGGGVARHAIIKDHQIIKEECVPNITKTCKSLYVFCDSSLYNNDVDESANVYLRNSETAPSQIWPWIAKIFIEGDYKCTGVLVDLSWVLVSESCLWDTTLGSNYITAILGSHITLDTTNGFYEQVYQVDAKKEIFPSKAVLLHLERPANYSNGVKPMIVTSLFNYLDSKSSCVAVGQDYKNNTVSVLLKETGEHCNPSNRCFTRQSKQSICPAGISSNRHWAGIISCHTDQGWFPAATFVDSRGECGLEDHINATDIENLKNEIKNFYGKKMLITTGSHNHSCEGIRCRRGRCVSLLLMCDGVRQCEDGNDESELACEKKNAICTEDPYHRGCECSVGQMKCHNGKCISKELFKDGNDDCGDGTDEPEETKCADYLRRAMPQRLCDGVLHCHDRSDEDPVFCKCFTKTAYRCGQFSGVDYCVASDTVCDGVRDCPNGNDEQTCIALNRQPGMPYGTGQVMVRSHGVWHSKCYSTSNHTRSQLEQICAELGFIGGHARQIHENGKLNVHQHNHLLIDPFDDIALNNNTIIKIRNTHEPIAKAIFDENLTNCYPVFIECL